MSNLRSRNSQDVEMIAEARQEKFSSDRDRQLHAAATEMLAKSQYTPLRRLSCRVDRGTVEISGTVSSYYLKQLAQAAMQRVRPEGRVRNLVQVREPGKPAMTA